MGKRVKHGDSYYLKLFQTLSSVHDFSFRPKRGQFTAAQKSAIVRRSFYWDEIEGQKVAKHTHLYNIASLVSKEKYSVLTPKKRDKKTRKMRTDKSVLKWADNYGFFTHQGKVIIRRENVNKPKIVKSGDSYVLEYRYTKPKKTGQRALTRYELFVPFPVEILGDALLCEAFIHHVQKCFRGFTFSLAINGNSSKTAYDPKIMNAYAHDMFCNQEKNISGPESVYLNGLYVVSSKPINPKKLFCIDSVIMDDVYSDADQLEGCESDDDF